MGEARRRRLALIKGGQADEAKKDENNPKPVRIREYHVITSKMLGDKIEQTYDEEVNKKVLASLNAFLERLLAAGLASFMQARQQQEQAGQLIQTATPKEAEEIAKRLKAAKEGRI